MNFLYKYVFNYPYTHMYIIAGLSVSRIYENMYKIQIIKIIISFLINIHLKFHLKLPIKLLEFQSPVYSYEKISELLYECITNNLKTQTFLSSRYDRFSTFLQFKILTLPLSN